MISVRKIKVRCDDKEFYSFFNNEQREQNKALNLSIGYIHASNILKNNDSGAEVRILKSVDKLQSKIDKFKEEVKDSSITIKRKKSIQKSIETTQELLNAEKDLLEKGRKYRKGLDKEFSEIYIDNNNLYYLLNDQTKIRYMRTIDLVKQKTKQDYSSNYVDIVTGKISLMNYKQDFPLMIEKKTMSIYKKQDKYFLRIMLGFELEIITGNRDNKATKEFKYFLNKCIKGDYVICQSTIQKDRNDNIIFNLTVDIPNENKKYKPIENRVLGVDLGIRNPIFMTLNDNTDKFRSLGNAENFLRLRKQSKERRHKLQSDLALINGDSQKKIRTFNSFEKLKDNEKNFAQTYNHLLSKKVVEYAKDLKCEYIHLERIKKDSFNKKVFKNWSIYQLQNFIEYKAKREGILVKHIDPTNTSIMCSKCGHIEKANRKNSADFKCIKCDFKSDADYNAAINISRSKQFVK